MSDLFLPPHLLDSHRWRNLRIGLLGGSFNPAHEGHVHVSVVGARALELDCIWWLVSPQNPLKPSNDTKPFAQRMEQCLELAGGMPRIVVSNIEQQLGTTRTFDTLTRLLPRFPGTNFVWLTGFDIALEFHRWHRWREITGLIATAHVTRPPAMSLIRNCPLRQLGTRQIHVSRACPAPLHPHITYWIMEERMNAQSSTLLRSLLN